MVREKKSVGEEKALEPAGPEVLEKVEKICDILHRMSFNEVEYEEKGFKLKVTRDRVEPRPLHALPMMAPAYFPPSPLPPPPPPLPAVARAVPAAAIDEFADAKKITAPISGTFYTSPAPGAPPFVNGGDTVSMGQVVCIIGAMKIMNEIKATCAGKIVKVCKKNEDSVRSGETLYFVR